MRASGVLISFAVLTGPAVRSTLEGVGCVLSGFLGSCTVIAVLYAILSTDYTLPLFRVPTRF